MKPSDFYVKSNQKKTALSGNRPYYSQRPKVIVTETRDVSLTDWDTPYGFSEELFGTDTSVFYILDCNKPADAFSWYVGQDKKLPVSISVSPTKNIW